MKKLTGLLFSMELTGMLILLFTVSIGFATFIENDFGTLTAKANVYNARWFEFMLLLLAVNMTGSIVKHKMYLRAKWPVFIFHVSFLIILLGAAVTRYIGYEGSMAIREGNSSSEIVSGDTYIRIWAEEGQDQVYTEKKVFALPGKVSGFDRSLDLNGRSVEVEVVDYFKNATEKYVEEEGGFEVLLIVYADDRTGRQDIYLKNGDVKRV
ncbi:MAG TPA: cytochrome c biogenesis protein ResB, partial [Bacteroidales bacterium]|nr:cytochrome c biogenesis protein ResB [Bacteroidales bacterium]